MHIIKTLAIHRVVEHGHGGGGRGGDEPSDQRPVVSDREVDRGSRVIGIRMGIS
jgi:hypothetical protein